MLDTNRHILNLINHIREKFPLTDAEVQMMTQIVSVRELKKKENLIEPGGYSLNMNFISEGCLRAYYNDESGQEHTLQLGIENWWVNDLYGYITEKPSKMYVQALEHSTIVQLPKKDLEAIYSSIPAISNFFREKIQGAYVALQERTIENMSADSFNRYVTFRKQYRDIEQRVPQYIVASYLGITPEFLSHLRKKHATDLS